MTTEAHQGSPDSAPTIHLPDDRIRVRPIAEEVASSKLVPEDRIQVLTDADDVSLAPPPPQMTWREKRWERRRRRIWFEEILAWLLVPVIVIGTYWFIYMILNGLGTSPAAIFEGVKAILAAL